MANIKLSKFITNLQNFKKQPIDYVANKEVLFKIIYSILYLMAKYTRPDTGQARWLLIDDISRKLGKNPEELAEEYYYWVYNPEDSFAERKEQYRNGTSIYGEWREWGTHSENSVMTENKSSKKYSMQLSINDGGLWSQEQKHAGSPHHPRDGNYFPHHLSKVEKYFRDGRYEMFSQMNWNDIINDLILKIETGLFK